MIKKKNYRQDIFPEVFPFIVFKNNTLRRFVNTFGKRLGSAMALPLLSAIKTNISTGKNREIYELYMA